MICPNCGTETGNAKFCPECGTKVAVPEDTAEAVKNTEEILAETSDAQSGDKYGATAVEETVASEIEPAAEPEEPAGYEENYSQPVSQPAGPEEPAGYEENYYPPIVQPAAPEAPVAADEKPKKKGKKGLIAAIAILLVLALAGAGAVYYFFFRKPPEMAVESKQYTLYVKENSVYYMNPDEEEPVLITDSFFKERDDVDISDIALIDLFELTDYDNSIFYAQKVDVEDLSFALYRKDFNKPEEEPLKLAENVITYSASDDGTSVIYLDSDGSLYHHNMVEREKILSDIDNFWISDDCLSIVYLAKDGGLYYQPIGGDKDKIDSDVKSVEDISDDLKTIYYLKEDALYFKKEAEDKVKIDTDVESVVSIFDNGDVYYTKKNSEKGTGTLLDFVTYNKDQAKKDDKAEESMYYINDANDLEILLRHNVRKALKEMEYEYSSSSLYCFKDGKTDLVNSAYVSTYDSSDNMLVIKSYDDVNIKKQTLADIVDYVDKELDWRRIQKSNIKYTFYYSDVKGCKVFKDLEKTIKGAYETDATTYYVNGGKAIKLDVDSGSNFLLKDGSKVYYLSDKDEEKKTANVYELTIADGAVASNKKYDEGISTEKTFTVDEVGLVYFKDAKEETADMYVDKQLIEYDIGGYLVLSNGTILYYTDYDEDTQTGTAYLYSNGEKTKISEDAYHADEDANGNILFYKDFSKKFDKGDLYIFKDGVCTRVDYDVSWKYNAESKDKYRGFFTWSSVFNWDYEESEEEETEVEED